MLTEEFSEGAIHPISPSSGVVRDVACGMGSESFFETADDQMFFGQERKDLNILVEQPKDVDCTVKVLPAESTLVNGDGPESSPEDANELQPSDACLTSTTIDKEVHSVVAQQELSHLTEESPIGGVESPNVVEEVDQPNKTILPAKRSSAVVGESPFAFDTQTDLFQEDGKEGIEPSNPNNSEGRVVLSTSWSRSTIVRDPHQFQAKFRVFSNEYVEGAKYVEEEDRRPKRRAMQLDEDEVDPGAAAKNEQKPPPAVVVPHLLKQGKDGDSQDLDPALVKHSSDGNGYTKSPDGRPNKSVGGIKDQAPRGLNQFAFPGTDSIAVSTSPLHLSSLLQEHSKVNGAKPSPWHQPLQRSDVKPDGGLLHLGSQQGAMLHNGPQSHGPDQRAPWGRQQTFGSGVSTQPQPIQSMPVWQQFPWSFPNMDRPSGNRELGGVQSQCGPAAMDSPEGRMAGQSGASLASSPAIAQQRFANPLPTWPPPMALLPGQRFPQFQSQGSMGWPAGDHAGRPDVTPMLSVLFQVLSAINQPQGAHQADVVQKATEAMQQYQQQVQPDSMQGAVYQGQQGFHGLQQLGSGPILRPTPRWPPIRPLNSSPAPLYCHPPSPSAAPVPPGLQGGVNPGLMAMLATFMTGLQNASPPSHIGQPQPSQYNSFPPAGPHGAALGTGEMMAQQQHSVPASCMPDARNLWRPPPASDGA
eukprot:jgi/Botrbrau1/23049/Bobra.136_1s0037.1